MKPPGTRYFVSVRSKMHGGVKYVGFVPLTPEQLNKLFTLCIGRLEMNITYPNYPIIKLNNTPVLTSNFCPINPIYRCLVDDFHEVIILKTVLKVKLEVFCSCLGKLGFIYKSENVYRRKETFERKVFRISEWKYMERYLLCYNNNIM